MASGVAQLGEQHTVADALPPVDDVALHRRTADLLGLGAVGDQVRGPYDVHRVIRDGLPGAVLEALLGRLIVLPRSGKELEDVIGFSLRTMQRKRREAAPLSAEQAGRTWEFAEILARATEALGDQEAAERWLDRPAFGLNRQRPMELIKTPVGRRLVGDYLTRIQYGVYT